MKKDKYASGVKKGDYKKAYDDIKKDKVKRSHKKKVVKLKDHTLGLPSGVSSNPNDASSTPLDTHNPRQAIAGVVPYDANHMKLREEIPEKLKDVSSDNPIISTTNNIELGTNLEEDGFSTHTTSSEEEQHIAVPLADPQTYTSAKIGRPEDLLLEELLGKVNEITEKMATKEFVDTMVGDSILAYHNKIFPPATGTAGTGTAGTQEFTSTVTNGPMQPTATGTPPLDTKIGNPGSRSMLDNSPTIINAVTEGIRLIREVVLPPPDPMAAQMGKLGMQITQNVMEGIAKKTLKTAITEGFTPPHMEQDH